MKEQPVFEEETLRAWYLGGRIARRPLPQDSLDPAPIVDRVREGGLAFIFRFGVLVTYGLSPSEEARYREALAPMISDPFAAPETEEIRIQLGAGPLRVDASGALVVEKIDADTLEVAANVLAKSVVLAHFEAQVAPVLTRIEGLAGDLRRGRSPVRRKSLLNEIGTVMLVRSSTVGRAEVSEKPEITWENPVLDRLYERLAHEFELGDRDAALSRKLELVSGTTETYLDLIQTRQSLRLEWYIVTLILVEILLILYDIFAH